MTAEPGLSPGRTVIIIFLVILTIAVAVVLSSGSLPASPDTGTGALTGTVSIGPLCPVEPCTVSHDRLVAAFEAHPITITTTGGSPVSTVIADPDTGYRVVLKPGTYIVDIPHPGIGGSRNLPATVTIRSGETVRLDISIDTGIR